MTNLHPCIPLVLGAIAIPLLPRLGQRVVLLLAATVSAVCVLQLPLDHTLTVEMAAFELRILHNDALARVFALAFAVYGVIAAIFAWGEDGKIAKLSSLLLIAGGVGVALAGDLLTLFFFWEWLSITSLLLIWQGGSKESLAAGYRYIMLHVIGGMCLLAGILLVATDAQSFEFAAVSDYRGSIAPVLILLGMLTNAAVPPLHAWLPDAYPRASIYGTVFLSAFTTKAAVYALARLFPGLELLVWIGTAMALFGVFFAVLENNIRRLLCYHIVSQVGYMVTGIGLGTALALNGTAAHAFSHIFYKGLLMMSAGAVIYATGRERLSELGSLARPLRLTLIFFMIGALSISGAPYFNGYISKSIIVSAAAYEKRAAVELLLIIASMGTFLSIGLKLPWLAFVTKSKDPRPVIERKVPGSMYCAMALASVVCIGSGIAPGYLYDLLPDPSTRYHPFTAAHFVQVVQLLLATTLGFWLLRKKFDRKAKITLDVDQLYRKPLAVLLDYTGGFLAQLGTHSSNLGTRFVDSSWNVLQKKHLRLAQSTISFHATLILFSFGVLAVLAFLL